MWKSALSVDNLSEVSEAGTGRTGSTSGRSAYSENLEELRTLLGLAEDEEVFFDRFRIDRKKLEDMILNDNEALANTHQFFQKIMDSTGTNIAWPSRLKIGAKTKKGNYDRFHFGVVVRPMRTNPETLDPHVRVAAKTMQDVVTAKELIISSLGIRNKQVTLKVNVSYTHHSHIIGEGGQTITRVRQSTGCHIHFPDSNRSFSEMKSNQVSITGSMEGVEKARAQVRDLVPLVFCFELPILGVVQNCPDAMSTYIQNVSDKYHVHVSYRTRSRFHATLVVVKGREWEMDNVKEATLLLIHHLCGNMAGQVPVQMTMEISPHHHAMVLGPQSQYLKAIMENTQTQILFPDATDPNIPVLKKSNVTITGQINDVYRARQQLMGSLPITLIFTLADNKAPLDQQRVLELSEKLDVSISTRQCPKQNTISVIVRGVERNTGNVYEARRRLLKLEEIIAASVPESYVMPNAPKIFDKEPNGNVTNSRPSPEFQLPEVRPAFSPVDLSPIMLGPMPMWNLPSWGQLLLPQQHAAQILQKPQQHPLFFPQRRPTVPPGIIPNRDLSVNSSGYVSNFNSTSPTLENTAFSAFSSLSSSMSSLGISSGNLSPSSTTHGLEGPTTPTNTDWIERTLESPQSTTLTPGDYDQKRMMAAKAFKNKPKGVEVRVPTPTWSGYGLSLSSPSTAFKSHDIFTKRSELYDNSIWNSSECSVSPQSKFSVEPENMFLSASNNLESVPPGMLKRIQAPEQDLSSLLASIGLEKYIQLFASQEIDMASFQMFTDSNLKELGVLAYGPRHKMLLAIAELKKRRSPLLNAAPGAERKRSGGWPKQE